MAWHGNSMNQRSLPSLRWQGGDHVQPQICCDLFETQRCETWWFLFNGLSDEFLGLGWWMVCEWLVNYFSICSCASWRVLLQWVRSWCCRCGEPYQAEHHPANLCDCLKVAKSAACSFGNENIRDFANVAPPLWVAFQVIFVIIKWLGIPGIGPVVMDRPITWPCSFFSAMSWELGGGALPRLCWAVARWAWNSWSTKGSPSELQNMNMCFANWNTISDFSNSEVNLQLQTS